MISDNSNEYEANYKSALSFLKLSLKEQALDCLMRAYDYIPEGQKNAHNAVYLDILDNLAILLMEKSERARVIIFVEEGLSVKKNHTDLLFLKSLLLLDEKRFDEMLEALIQYFLSLAEEDASLFKYKYTHEGVLKEIYENLLPSAYRYAFEGAAIRDITDRLVRTTSNEWLRKAHDIMIQIDGMRSNQEH